LPLLGVDEGEFVGRLLGEIPESEIGHGGSLWGRIDDSATSVHRVIGALKVAWKG
jgi:hypothetical protein